MKKSNPQLSDKLKADLKGSLKYIIFILSLFLISTLIGVVAADILKDFINPILQEMVDKTKDLNAPQLMMFIFFNNAFTSLGAIIFGIFAGIMPLITTISNGVVLGYVMERVAQVTGLGELWRLFPHGIFELPAVFISLALGFKLGITPMINYFSYYKKKNKFLYILPILIALILSILAIGAITSIGTEKSKTLSALPKTIAMPVLTIGAIVIYFAITSLILIFFTAIKDKKLRKIQISSFKENFTSSIRIFCFLIVPLLFLAAIIEGLLIFILP